MTGTGYRTATERRYRHGIALTLLSSIVLSSCAAAPLLIPVAIEFARNLIQTSLSNYGSKHRDNISTLVDRLASPYVQHLSPVGPGMQGQQGYFGQSMQPGQPSYPGQQSYPGQSGSYNPYGMGGTGYPGAGTYPGTTPDQYGAAPGYPSQPGYDPNNPYGTGGTGYPGAGTYPGTTPDQYGAAPGYPSQPGYDPNNPYGTGGTGYPGAGTYPGTTPGQYGAAPGYPPQPGYDPNNPYGATTPHPAGQTNPYGTAVSPNPYGAQDPYAHAGSAGYPTQPGTTAPYGSPNVYGGPSSYPSQPPVQTNPYGGSPQPYGSQNPYGDTAYPPQTGQINPYGTAYPHGSAPNQASQAYDPNNPYGNSGAGQGYGQSQSAYGHPQSGYGQQQSAYGTPAPHGMQQPPPQYGGGYGTTGQPYGGQYGNPGIYPRGLIAEPVAVDVAMIRQKVTEHGKEVMLMNDGEVLKDGGVNKDAGDRFKIVVRTNCDCYLYITTIDGSGWAEPVFPASDSKIQNPVKKDQEYAFPADGHWYTLDQAKGIESFFVVASANRRQDLEESFAQLAAEKRPEVKMVAKVEEPPIIPRGVGSVTTRGILKVQDDTGTTVQVTPLSYAASQSGQDVTVTRWFKHE